MSLHARAVVDALLRGERDVGQVRADLEEVVAFNPAAAEEVRAYLDELYRSGRLPF